MSNSSASASASGTTQPPPPAEDSSPVSKHNDRLKREPDVFSKDIFVIADEITGNARLSVQRALERRGGVVTERLSDRITKAIVGTEYAKPAPIPVYPLNEAPHVKTANNMIRRYCKRVVQGEVVAPLEEGLEVVPAKWIWERLKGEDYHWEIRGFHVKSANQKWKQHRDAGHI